MPKRTVPKPSLDTFFLEGKKWIQKGRYHENYRVSYAVIMQRAQAKISLNPNKKNIVGDSLHEVYTEITGESPTFHYPINGSEIRTARPKTPKYAPVAEVLLDRLHFWLEHMPRIDIELYDEQVRKEEARGVDIETQRDLGII